MIKAAVALPAGVAELCEGHQLQLDISLEGLGHSGAASTKLTRDVFCAHLPSLQPLVLVVKSMLVAQGLNCAASGGLGSYALVLMATSLLQQQAAAASSPSSPAAVGVGHLLVRFLEYFSALPETPDALHAVVLDSASRLQPKRLRREQLLSGGRDAESVDDDALYEEAVFASSLLVQDPLEPKFSNVTGVTFRWGLVQRLFRQALQRLQGALEAEQPTPPAELLAKLLRDGSS